MLKKMISKYIYRFLSPHMRGWPTSKSNNVRIGSTSYIIGIENLTIEDGVFIGQYNIIDASNSLVIKEGCQITNYVSILTHSSHVSVRLYGERYRQEPNPKGMEKGSVSIGARSFIGPHVVIMPGTIIGKGCLIKAYSYVRGSFPDFAVIEGNPAKVVGDCREIDMKHLDGDLELYQSYLEWINAN